MPSNLILEVNNLSKNFHIKNSNIFSKDKVIKALDDISFNIKKGEIFGLVGESGCGKSTLGRSIVGLTKDVEGQIFFEGKNIKNIKRLSKKVQIIFQDPLSSLNPKKKIGWILEEPLKIHKIGNKEQRLNMVNKILDLIGLDNSYKDKYAKELSGGQRQRISIGSALMLNPELIIADEPVSALDVSVQSQILNLMLDLHEKLNLAYLFISHNLDVVYYMCDRVAVMYAGKIVEIASAEEIYDKPLHPYTKVLLNSVLKFDENIDLSNEITEGNRNLSVEFSCPYYKKCTYAKEECRTKAPKIKNINGENELEHLVRCNLF
ncbi:oligopeptide/dipeptide ABC transporter ATP-binding protein [Clostridium pasteurianum]|uniref:Oligopeptide/dipeptide ABC transporter, ATP-binding protein n=1 Tax=Clostridium pasteurianum BC1 TaxID=86416 RepID=R4K6U3_CLOPA|nr:oligopeptide/dipeptide ABC transporter ATP-binding protein [Clostridium pasteurianum]AGK98902.1 oligopeptide/dipeptide ABC transporter, ATP-binding protein [Clostridium pasteurianum BC1]